MDPVTSSCGGCFPPKLIFSRAKAPNTTANEETRPISKFRPPGLSQGTAKRVRIVAIRLNLKPRLARSGTNRDRSYNATA
jgi:hypothetical protein